VHSVLAGGAAVLRQAWLVNPYDINGMKSALLDAYGAEGKETSRRMKAMRKTVIQHDVAAWADSFLAELSAVRPSHGKSVRPAKRS
jgi:trehalose 6-phosphate synthase